MEHCAISRFLRALVPRQYTANEVFFNELPDQQSLRDFYAYSRYAPSKRASW